MNKKSKDESIAEESEKTKKARQKLQKFLEGVDGKMTDEALGKKNEEIHRWIGRHAKNRVVLKAKSISLFDENQNPAGHSEQINDLLSELEE